MTDASRRSPRQRADRRYGRIVLALAALLFALLHPRSLHAADPPLEIVVSGVSGAAEQNVRGALHLPAGLARDGVMDRLWLEGFAAEAEEKTRKALEPFGYYQPKVTVALFATESPPRLQVTVVPGGAVHLSTVTVTLAGAGREESALRRLVARFPLQPGDVLLQQRYEEAKEELVDQARSLGYLDAAFSRHEIRIDATATTATIELLLETGARYSFGRTRISGAPDYPESFLRRHLTYRQGELFSYPRLGESQRNFSNSERFTTVRITPEKEEAEDFQVPVTIELQSGPTVSLRPGIGYGTDTGSRISLRYRDLNTFHLGHELYSQLYVAERLQGLVTGYIIPSSKDVRSSISLQLNLQQEETSAYSSRIMALELDRNRSFGSAQLGTAYVKFQYEDYTVGTEKSYARLVLPGLRFSANRYDNPIRPHRGFRYALDVHGTHQSLGSDTALLQILVEGSYLFPLPWRLSLQTRSKGGVTLFNDPLRDIPPSLRFFAGGDQSVRGYSYKSLGPRNPSGQVVGGEQLLTGSIELERAILTDWGLSLFYDIGNAFDSFTAMSFYQGAGVGLHYFTAIGALNLSVARPLGVNNPSLHLHFTVGFEL